MATTTMEETATAAKRRSRRRPQRPWELGSRLRRLRELQGVSQRELVRRTGLQASYISKVEHGRVHPGIANLDRLARAMGLSLAEVFAVPGGRRRPRRRA